MELLIDGEPTKSNWQIIELLRIAVMNPDIYVLTTQNIKGCRDRNYFIYPSTKLELTDNILIMYNGFVREVIDLGQETPYKIELARLIEERLKRDCS